VCPWFRLGWAVRCAACCLGVALLAACAGADDSGQTQTFAAHINGSYTAAAVSTSTP
jgi:uncharacterized lipoprotein YehR (DUF1307 family)